jgi:hypothetical protein
VHGDRLPRPDAPTGEFADELKDRVVDLAREIIHCWQLIADQPGMVQHRATMNAALEQALADGDTTARRLNIPAPLPTR